MKWGPGPWEGRGEAQGEARQGQSGQLMPSGTFIWVFLNGVFKFRYFGFYFRHLECFRFCLCPHYALLSLQGSAASSKL